MRLNTLSPAEGSKRRVNAWVVVSVLASVKPVVVVTKVRSLVLAVAYVAVSRGSDASVPSSAEIRLHFS